jgi:hypothetical protein
MCRKVLLPRALVMTAVIASVLGSVLPAKAQGFGAIGGSVMDSTGAVLPGATVQLSSTQGTVGSNQEATADARGAYEFLRLVPGSYIVKATMQGFRPAEQRNIVVNADQTARADLSLTIGQLEEGVVVSGEAPLLDTTSALKQTVLSQDVLQTLPNRIDVWSITRVIPSVVASKVDVGGSESFQQSSVTVHGTTNETGYYIDGMNVSSTQSNGSIATFYLDPYAFVENNFLSGNSPAEAPTGGLVFNMISRTGTNATHGGGFFAGTNSHFSSYNVSPALQVQLLKNIPAAVLVKNPNVKPGQNLQYLHDEGGWIAGPVFQDKLWYSASVHYQQILQHLIGSYNSDGTQVPDNNLLFNVSGKLAWQVSHSSQLSWFYIVQHKVNGHRASTTMFVQSGATTFNSKTPQLHQVKWTKPLRSKMVLDVSGSLNRVDDYQPWPAEGDTSGCTAAANRTGCTNGLIAGFDAVTNTLLRILPAYRDLPNTRVFLQGSAGYFAGRHDIKLGYQFDYAWNEVVNFSSSDMRAVYRSGVPDSVNTYNTPTDAIPENIQQGLYVQDKWTPARKLTMNLGLRLDTNVGWQRASSQPATPFIAAQNFPAIHNVPNWKVVNPRFSAIYDLGGDGKTALKFAANRYIIPVGSGVLDRINPVSVASDTRAWTACTPGQTSGCDLNGDGLPQLNELGPSSGYNFGQLGHYAPGYKWPWADEFSAELQRQLPGNMVATVGYTRRLKKGNFGSRNLSVPTDSYIPLTVTEVNSGQTVTVYNQAPALRGLQNILFFNATELDSVYNGSDISIDKRMSNHWMMTGGVSLGKNVGWVGNTDLNNPNSKQFSRGLVGNDTPFSLRLSGVVDLPFRVSASATFQHQVGYPETTQVSVGNNTVTLTQGTTVLTVAPVGTTRLPNLNQLDTSFRRAFRAGSKVYQARFDAYNLLNNATVINRNTVLGPTYDFVNNIQRGRLIKLGMTVDF